LPSAQAVIKHFTNFGGAVLSVLPADMKLLERLSGVAAAVHCGDELRAVGPRL